MASNPAEKTAPSADVIVVGGGMGGLALGLALGRLGRTVVIVERQARLEPLRRGELLQPNGLRILDQLGILEKLTRHPFYTARSFHFHRIGGERLLTIDYGMLPPPWNYALAVEPHFLLGALMEEIAANPNVRIITETEFTGVVREGTRIVGVNVVQNGEDAMISGPLVVGSDGALSRVRSAVGIRAQVHAYSDVYLTLVIPRPPGFESGARYYIGHSEILGLFPLSEEKLYLLYMVGTRDLSRLKRDPVGGVLSRMIRIHPGLAGPLASVDSWEPIGLMPCYRVRAERWASDGAVLMGDSVHAMNPHVAQGRNQALEDAMTLVGAVGRAFERGDFSAAAFADYEALRRPVVEVLQRQADEMVFFWNTGWLPMVRIRDRAFRTLDRDPGLRYKMLALIAGHSRRRFTVTDRLRASGLFPLFFRPEKV